jgi:hypothetical protein
MSSRGFWQILGSLLLVWVLVLGEPGDLQVGHAIDRVHLDEAACDQLTKQRIDAAIVVRQQLRLDPGTPVNHPAVAVHDGPKPREQQPRQWIALGQQVVGEEPRFDKPSPGH